MMVAAHPDFPAIEDHGVIGDLHTVALVALDGTIDFFCYPHFDSPTLFAALLDPDKGGYFRIAPTDECVRRRQLYLPNTNILITRFATVDGIAEVVDFMPADGSSRLIRRICGVRGRLVLDLRCAPRFAYGKDVPALQPVDDGVLFYGNDSALRLSASIPLAIADNAAQAQVELAAGDRIDVMLAPADAEPLDSAGYERVFSDTARFWRNWVTHSTYTGRWREIVQRSALVLKLLTSKKYGSIAAAATFGLPEAVGGTRNWDYRYCWLRDSAFTLYALMRLGFVGEATAFINWLFGRMAGCHQDGTLQIMYGLDGRADLEEIELDHLRGYQDSRPVRVGNGAYDQLQLDIYGELMDAVYIAGKSAGMIYKAGWRQLTRTIDWVCHNWREPDRGIWEIRGDSKPFLSSRLMCWVAVDRALRLASKQSLPAPFARWEQVRNDIHDSILDDFWDSELAAFVQYQGAKTLDASVLLMPLVKFINPTDPRWLKTLERVGERLTNDCLVKRYATGGLGDGLDGDEGAFTTCSFWYVECLARAGQIDRAHLLFEKMLSYANHLGLYAEELDPAGGHLSNFPQALTHLSLISAATYLDRALDGDGGWVQAAQAMTAQQPDEV